MGVGDWIIASADAERVPEGTKAAFGRPGKIHWSEVFENNPKISKTPGHDVVWVQNYPGARPYIKSIVPYTSYTFHENYRVPYGRIYLTDREKDWADRQVKGDFILVEPYVKEGLAGIQYLGHNKAWHQWDELLKLDYPWLQIGTKKPKVRQVRTETIRQMLAMVSKAKLVVTTDGALHHAAAALGVPAVVLWGGFVSPKILGYPTHTNLWSGAKPCGWFKSPCPHCREAMQSISVDMVRSALDATAVSGNTSLNGRTGTAVPAGER